MEPYDDENDHEPIPRERQEEPLRQQQQQQQQQHRSILRNRVILSILATETAERVAYFGFRAVLVLYLRNGLRFSESASVSLFAAVSALAYFSPLVGALFADSRWGRYKTIWRFAALYSIGLCLVTLGASRLGPPLPISCPISMGGGNSSNNTNNTNTSDCGDITDELNKTREVGGDDDLLVPRALSFVGLILVCLGTGGIKPCVSAFGADQVVLSDAHTTQTYADVDHEGVSDLVLDENTSTAKTEPAAKPGSSDSGENPSGDRKEDQVREFFNSFYFCINVGALFSFAVIPMVRAHFGFGATFFVPTMFMMGALLMFFSQHNAYKHRTRDSSQPSLFSTLSLCLAILFAKRKGSYHHIDNAATESSGRDPPSSTTRHFTGVVEEEHFGTITPAGGEDATEIKTVVNNLQARQDAEQVMHLMPLMMFFPVFWMLYDQQSSVWTFQATRLDCHGLQPEQTGILNPLEIMLFIPLFDRILYPWLESKGFNIQPLRRMEYGMLLAAVAFFASTVLEYSIQRAPPESVSLAWQIPQITILTVAEILLNVTGLEFAYSQAPESMQALILAVYLCTTAVGDGFGSLLFATVFRDLNPAVTMVTCAVCMLLNLALFSRVARRWKPFNARNEANRHRTNRPGDNEDEDVGVQLNVLT